MEKTAVKNLLYGGLMELLNDREYYYNSGIAFDYNHFTDQGKLAVEEYIKQMAVLMIASENKSLDKRAKELVINNLKGTVV